MVNEHEAHTLIQNNRGWGRGGGYALDQVKYSPTLANNYIILLYSKEKLSCLSQITTWSGEIFWLHD